MAGSSQNQNLIATIVANGETFSSWESVEIWREWGSTYSYMKFRCAEDTVIGSLPPAYSLDAGDPADGYLDGILVISGFVMTRQVCYAAGVHQVEIIVCSLTQSVDAATVKASPGQYLNQDIKQIVTAVLKPVGLSLRMVGDLSNALLPFERVSEHVGERISDFVSRLAFIRNLHICDDENGNLVLGRGQAGGGGGLWLREGVNILSARLVDSIMSSVNQIVLDGQQHGSDQHHGTDASQIRQTVKMAGYPSVAPPRDAHILHAHTVNSKEAQMAASQAHNLLQAARWEVTITAPGWYTPDGDLWIRHCVTTQAFESVSITSPMLEPRTSGVIQGPDGKGLYIKGVKHMQDNEQGSRTEIVCASMNAFSMVQMGGG